MKRYFIKQANFTTSSYEIIELLITDVDLEEKIKVLRQAESYFFFLLNIRLIKFPPLEPELLNGTIFFYSPCVINIRSKTLHQRKLALYDIIWA